MEPPIGYIALQQATDIVGRRLIGATWHQLFDAREYAAHVIAWRLLTADPVVERVITEIAERCEAGEIAAAYRSITGADNLDHAEWRKPQWRNYFWDGTIELDLPLLDSKLRPNPNGYTARCTREIFIRKDDLIAWLDRKVPATSTAPQGQRYATDDELVAEGIRCVRARKKGWANALQAAKALAARAEGASTESTITRLRKKISAGLETEPPNVSNQI